jgi:hypothetical protein
MERPVAPGWELDARQMTLHCNQTVVSKSKEAKTSLSNSRQMWQKLLWKAMAQKGLFF